jgi:hypothetical protein
MFTDKQAIFSDAQAITADARSTNQIDLGVPGNVFSGRAQTRDIGRGMPLKVWAIVDTTFATIVSMNIVLRCDNDTAFGSPRVLWTSDLFLLAEMVAGFKFPLPDVPWDCNERYLELFYDVNTSATAGAVTAGLAIDDQLGSPTG